MENKSFPSAWLSPTSSHACPEPSLERRAEFHGWVPWIRTHAWRRATVSLLCLTCWWERSGRMLVLDRRLNVITTISDFRGTPQTQGTRAGKLTGHLGSWSTIISLGSFLSYTPFLNWRAASKIFLLGESETWEKGSQIHPFLGREK